VRGRVSRTSGKAYGGTSPETYTPVAENGDVRGEGEVLQWAGLRRQGDLGRMIGSGTTLRNQHCRGKEGLNAPRGGGEKEGEVNVRRRGKTL